MNSNDTSLYDQIKEILLHYPDMRWSSREVGPRAPVIGLEKIDAVQLLIADVSFLNRLRSTRGQSLIFRRINSRHSTEGWRKLYDAFEKKECLVYRQSTTIKGESDLYILVRTGLYYEGIKTKEIETVHDR
jgi:hypothetical protein